MTCIAYQSIGQGLHASIQVHVVLIVTCWLVHAHGWFDTEEEAMAVT